MKKLVVYLDTSVLNFLFADDAPEKRDITLERHVRALCLIEGYSDKIEMRDPMGVISDE